MPDLMIHFGAWYHGTHRELEPGDMIEPGHEQNFATGPSTHVHMTPSSDDALRYAKTVANSKGVADQSRRISPHVYEVEPTGSYERDPIGEGSDDRRSRDPLRVVRKVTKDWGLPHEALLEHFAVLAEPLRNPYHGTSQFGGNPEFSHIWFHGTTGRDEPDLSQGRPEEMHRSAGSSWPQPNKLLGTHFTPLRSVAQQFAHGVYASKIGEGSPGTPSAIVHAQLNMTNPKHYSTERGMDLDIARWASRNHPDWHNQELNDNRAWNYSDSEGTHRDWHAPVEDKAAYALGNKAQDLLQWHPKLPEILHGFTEHLHSQGHDGITYGNEVEGPGDWTSKAKHISAITTRPSQIETRRVEHIAPPNFGRKGDPPPEPHQIAHKASVALSEPEDMLARVVKFHAQHGGMLPHLAKTAYVPQHHLSLGESARIIARTRKQGGLSANLSNGRTPHSGFMVAHKDGSHIMDASDFYGAKGPRILRDYVGAHHHALHHPAAHLGTWHDQDSGKVFLDIAHNIKDKETAAGDARKNNQIAMWDLGRNEEVATGGTGGLEKAAAASCPRCGLEQTDTSATMQYLRSQRGRTASIGARSEYDDDEPLHVEVEMHRGVPARLPPGDHAFVHDASKPVADRAAVLMQHMRPRMEYDKYGGGGIGKHWSISEKSARGFSTSNEPGSSPYDFKMDPKGTSVIFHAAPPKPAHLITSPRTKMNRDILPGSHGEQEVPLRRKAPVTLTGVSWGQMHKSAPMTRHDFPQPIRVKASAEERPLYHGSTHRFKPGDMIGPGHKGWPDSSKKHVYLTPDESTARSFGGLAAQRNGTRTYTVYHVEPTGPVEQDPDSNRAALRSQHPLRVVKVHERGSAPGDPNPWWDQPGTGKGYKRQASAAPDPRDYAEGMHTSFVAEHYWDPSIPKEKFRAAERPYLDRLKSRIDREGMQSPIEIKHHPESGRTYIEDGLHRLLAAEELGHVSVSAYFSTPDGPVRPSTYRAGEMTGKYSHCKTAAADRAAYSRRQASSDGDRHVTCAEGHEHWGAYGAAGLLIRHKGEDGQHRYLLQKRSPYVNEPDTWSVPGGAIGKHETPEQGAWREAREEMGSIPSHVKTHHIVKSTECGDWKYHTVVADAEEHFMPRGGGTTSDETAGVGWHTASEIEDLRDQGDLHPGFAKSWDAVRRSRGPKTAAREHVTWYHGTDHEHAAGIEGTGLRPSGRGATVGKDLYDAYHFAKDRVRGHPGLKPAIVTLSIPAEEEARYIARPGHSISDLNEHVPPQYISDVAVDPANPGTPKTAAKSYRLWRGEGSHTDAPVSESSKGRWFTPDRVTAEDYAYQHKGHLYHLDVGDRDKKHIAHTDSVWKGITGGGSVSVLADEELAGRKEHHAEGCPSCDPGNDETHRHQREWLKRQAIIEPGSLPARQQSAFDVEDHREHRRQMLDIAKRPDPGTRVWRGEMRPSDEHPKDVTSVGMHWSANPDSIIAQDTGEPGRRRVVFQGVMEDHGESAFPRGHPIWRGRHQSFDHEAEVRFRPGARVKLEGAYVDHTGNPGYLTPNKPERTSSGWEWHKLDHHVTVEHKGQGAADYSDVGIPREAAWFGTFLVAEPAMVS